MSTYGLPVGEGEGDGVGDAAGDPVGEGAAVGDGDGSGGHPLPPRLSSTFCSTPTISTSFDS